MLRIKNLLFFINREMDEIEIDNVNFERNRLLYKRSRENSLNYSSYPRA